MIGGCESETPIATEQPIKGFENLIVKSKASGVSQSTSPILTFTDMEVVGNSELVRTDNAVATKVHTTSLIHNQVTTLWWVIFNNPGECSGESCGEADLFDPAVEPSCPYADGDIVGGNGNSRFQDRLTVGESRNSCIDFFVETVPELEGEDHGLINPEGAEIHLVVRSHGTLKTGMVPEMRSTFFGGCEENLDPGTMPSAPGECADLQFAVHMPPVSGKY